MTIFFLLWLDLRQQKILNKFDPDRITRISKPDGFRKLLEGVQSSSSTLNQNGCKVEPPRSSPETLQVNKFSIEYHEGLQ